MSDEVRKKKEGVSKTKIRGIFRHFAWCNHDFMFPSMTGTMLSRRFVKYYYPIKLVRIMCFAGGGSCKAPNAITQIPENTNIIPPTGSLTCNLQKFAVILNTILHCLCPNYSIIYTLLGE